MTAERAGLLDKLGMVWNAQSAAWNSQFKDLQAFIAKEGHCQVPLNCTAFPKLGLWIKEQRRHYSLLKQGKTSHMTTDRIAQLESIGWSWDTHEDMWQYRLQELRAFKEAYGHCEVPANWVENPALATWVLYNRRQNKLFNLGKPCHITTQRIQALNQINFSWHCKARISTATTSAHDHDDNDKTALHEIHL